MLPIGLDNTFCLITDRDGIDSLRKIAANRVHALIYYGNRLFGNVV